jgi:hypothetical protein
MPDVASLPVNVIVNGWLYQPLLSACLSGVALTVGGVASLFIVTDTELLRPAPFVAEHVNVTPVVS